MLLFNGNRLFSAPSSRRQRTSRAAPLRFHLPSFARRPATSLPRLKRTLSTTLLIADPRTSSTLSNEAFGPTPFPTTTTLAPTTALLPPPILTRASPALRTRAAVALATQPISSAPFVTLQAVSLPLPAVSIPEPTFPSARNGDIPLLLPFDLPLRLLPTFPAQPSPLRGPLRDLLQLARPL